MSLHPALLITTLLTVICLNVNAVRANEMEIESVLVMTYQKVNLAEIKDEIQYSMDVEIDYSEEHSGWFGWLEYSSNLNDNEVANFFGDANSDAGTTEDSSGNGRLQISSLYYYQNDPDASINWQFGLAEVTTLIDTSDVAHNEVEQFLTAGLINNTTIGFPDYTLSGRMIFNELVPSGKLVLLISNAQGLSDNSGNYGRTLNPFKDDQGAFLATEYQWLSDDTALSLGIWRNSQSDSDGWYSSVDTQIGGMKLNARIGTAVIDSPAEALTEDNPHKQFLGLAIQYPLAKGELGAGWSYAKRHDELNSRDRNLEVYLRYPVTDSLFITPSIQLHNGQIIEQDVTDNNWLTSLRFQQNF